MLAREKRARNVTLIASSRFIALFSPLERKENKKKRKKKKKVADHNRYNRQTGANEWTMFASCFRYRIHFPGRVSPRRRYGRVTH